MKCITQIDLCVGRYNSDGFTLYIIDKTNNPNNTTKEKLLDLYDKIVFAVKRSRNDSDSAALFSKVYDITDPDQTDLDIFITGEETGLSDGAYFYELKGFKPSDQVSQTIAMGIFKVQETVIDSTDGTGFDS